MKALFFLLSSLFISPLTSTAQKPVLFEAGLTYLTKNLPPPTTLYDFGAFTFTTRYFLSKKANASIAFEAPVSFTVKINKGEAVHLGVQTPLLITYSFGSGASDMVSNKKMGYTFGTGVSWFYQQRRSKQGALPTYNESLPQIGPIVKAGVRFPGKTFSLFKENDNAVHASFAINLLQQFNVNNRNYNIGSVSVMVCFVF